MLTVNNRDFKCEYCCYCMGQYYTDRTIRPTAVWSSGLEWSEKGAGNCQVRPVVCCVVYYPVMFSHSTLPFL